MEQMKIADFYKDKEIFVTGGTGFMGRVLIEILSRSCSNLKIIYILLRPKKGKSICDRFNEFLDLPIFDNLRKNNPETLKKLIPISGDVAEKNLQISCEDFKRMSNVSIIFHSAATVRFNGSLKETLLLNTRGTLEVVNFAKTLKNLAALVYVSTAFSNPHQTLVEEKIYPPYTNWRDAIKIAENFENNVLNQLDVKYRSNDSPNVYTYTKNLAESIINDYKNELPCVIYRPVVVVSAIEEPLPGWIDNYNNIIGLMVACVHGILRIYSNSYFQNLPLVPVDSSIKGAIVAAYQKGVICKEKTGVVNVVNSVYRQISSKTIFENGLPILKKNPFENTILSPPNIMASNCKFITIIRFYIYQMFLAVIIDNILKYLGKKPNMVKFQRLLVDGNMVLDYFISRKWTIIHENYKKYEELIPKEEYETFSYHSKYVNVTNKEYVTIMISGIRKYLLKYSEICSPKGRKRETLSKYITYFLNLIYYLFLAFILMVFYQVLFK